MTTKEMIAVMQAYEEEKQIEFRLRDEIESTWGNTSRPCWDWYKYDYRIKPEEEKPARMTNRQLAKWCAGNNGQVTYKDSYVRTYYNYGQGEDDVPVREETRIRPWGFDEWTVPTVDIYNRDCKGE